ncbi:hypothetical protein HAX39_24555 [Citrobacter freundii]|nr:hypothetical protein [Citrobacter freundii]
MNHTVTLYHLFIRPGYHLHQDHWQLTSLADWREDYLARPGMRPVIDRQLRKMLAWRWPAEGGHLTHKQREWMSWLPELPRLLTALGLVHLACPEYLLRKDYRDSLASVLCPQTLNQLLGLWQAQSCPPVMMPDVLADGALRTGMRLFAQGNRTDWVWNMIWHTLPSDCGDTISSLSPERVHVHMQRLMRFI